MVSTSNVDSEADEVLFTYTTNRLRSPFHFASAVCNKPLFMCLISSTVDGMTASGRMTTVQLLSSLCKFFTFDAPMLRSASLQRLVIWRASLILSMTQAYMQRLDDRILVLHFPQAGLVKSASPRKGLYPSQIDPAGGGYCFFHQGLRQTCLRSTTAAGLPRNAARCAGAGRGGGGTMSCRRTTRHVRVSILIFSESHW